MTDNEIIKAYGCCNLSHNECGGCDNCPCKIEDDCIVSSGFDLEREVFKLLNRQKAKIEGLIAGQETLQKALNEKIEEVEELEKIKERYAISYANAVGRNLTIKSEAVKEFAERLKDRPRKHLLLRPDSYYK